ncbi:MAG: ABC transporter permease subunit [Chitinophagales bacterium]|nr:ABC transporter permease subunit [Chitinophagales bacterium]
MMVSNLWKIEVRKLVHNRTFWILTILYFLLMAFVLSSLNSFNITLNNDSDIQFDKFGIFRFPDIWQWLTYIAGFFMVIPAIVIIITVCNEYEFRTLRQNIVDGLTRSEFLFSKLITVALLSATSSILLLMLALILGYSYSNNVSFNSMWGNSHFILSYFLQLLGFLSFALMLAIIIKKAALTIGLLLLYTYVIEPIMVYKLPEKIALYMPLSIIRKLINSPFEKLMGGTLQQQININGVILTGFYLLLFTAIAMFVLQKRDL